MPPIPDPPSPLALIEDDNPQVIQQAQQKLSRKRRLSRVFTRSKQSATSEDRSLVASASAPSLVETPSTSSRKRDSRGANVQSSAPPLDDDSGITLDDSALVDNDLETDRYEWAIVYENQRGMTIFSIPYYSSLSLLPTDPSPFTLPNASLKRSKQALISLENYPLPDGNWRWVSRCWMIDMRADRGEVQHDGFEYNWMFRRTQWRAKVGSLNAGGWVRRRRWVRLMVRPAKHHVHTPKLGLDNTENASPHPSASSKATFDLAMRLNRLSIGSNFPPSLHTLGTEVSASTMSDWAQQIHPDEVWMGDAAGDWQRCRALLRRVGRDGKKLELWKLWLGLYHPAHKDTIEVEADRKGKYRDMGNRRAKQWTEDSGPLPSEVTYAEKAERDYTEMAPREHVVAVLRGYAKDIISTFVFPESRVQFLKLVAQAGMLSELNIELGIGFEGTDIDFWSYVSGLEDETGAKELLSTPTSTSLKALKTASAPNLGSASQQLPSSLSRKGKGKLLEVPNA